LHLREDLRHIQVRDVHLIKAVLQTRMNFEMAMTDAMLDFAEELCPEHTCLVPEKREELTTEGGLDIVKQFNDVQAAVKRLKTTGTEVSLFINPDLQQIDAVIDTGAPVIELHTGCYADAHDESTQARELARIQVAADYAASKGLIVNAGHGLHYHNVKAIAQIAVFNEFNIGHAIIARALFCGLAQAVKEMRQLMWEARQ
jgi:pyridoxine 5-phosphate synthase